MCSGANDDGYGLQGQEAEVAKGLYTVGGWGACPLTNLVVTPLLNGLVVAWLLTKLVVVSLLTKLVVATT